MIYFERSYMCGFKFEILISCSITMVSSLYQGVSKQTTLHCKMLSMSKVEYSIQNREFYPHHIILSKLSHESKIRTRGRGWLEVELARS